MFEYCWFGDSECGKTGDEMYTRVNITDKGNRYVGLEAR